MSWADQRIEIPLLTMAESTTTPAEAGETGPVASSTDTKFFVAVVKNIKGKADVDWVGVAAELQLKNPEVAKVSSPAQPTPLLSLLLITIYALPFDFCFLFFLCFLFLLFAFYLFFFN